MKFRVSKKEKYQGNNKPNIVYKNKYYNIEIDGILKSQGEFYGS